MIALDAPIARQVPIAFDLAGMARVASFRLARLALRANDGVHMSLWQVGNGSVRRGGHVGWRERCRGRVWRRHGALISLLMLYMGFASLSCAGGCECLCDLPTTRTGDSVTTWGNKRRLCSRPNDSGRLLLTTHHSDSVGIVREVIANRR